MHADLERDRFFTPREAVGYGLIDRVLHDRGAATARRVAAGLAG